MVSGGMRGTRVLKSMPRVIKSWILHKRDTYDVSSARRDDMIRLGSKQNIDLAFGRTAIPILGNLSPGLRDCFGSLSGMYAQG